MDFFKYKAKSTGIAWLRGSIFNAVIGKIRAIIYFILRSRWYSLVDCILLNQTPLIMEAPNPENKNTSTPPNLPVLKEDRQMLMIMHLSQLLNLITGFGGIIVPIILWQMKKDEIQDMDVQGKEVVNFQISLFIYAIAGSIMLLILVGFIILPVVLVISIVFPIIYGLKAKDGKPIKYPLTIPVIK